MKLREFIHDVLNKISISQGMLQSGIKILKDEKGDKNLAIQKLEKALNAVMQMSEIVQKLRSDPDYKSEQVENK